ncbi:hypothetical protein PR202_ga15269 [Eleusine coracana subsp. coracana]|uniref:Trichome birefringence-like N-terminal domain-containing protein n=1 Tax=Eleusine coracana subsp. coracana TaxID=191504 RepID=A0AAV5CJH2_ELECO|nr:hypothetical protein PR202_ga15269 [Eleusine coracana subsp. coracana]
MAEERRRSSLHAAFFCHGTALMVHLLVLAVAALTRCPSASAAAAGCDLFRGRWVVDDSYPLYDASACPFVPSAFDCRRNGRPDADYLRLRWRPDGYRLPRFDGLDFLRRWRGKRIKFVGDSLGMNQWVSFVCMLHAAVPAPARVTVLKTNGMAVSTVRFEDYDVSVVLHYTRFLVDVVKEDVGRVLNLGSMRRKATSWLRADLVVFNTWHWWTYKGAGQEWDLVHDGNGTYHRDMDRLTAFSKGLATWARWIDANVDPSRTRVFFQGISPSHYNYKPTEPESSDAAEATPTPVVGCYNRTQPLDDVATDAAGSGSQITAAQAVVQEVIGAMSTPVSLLDITELSQLRIDAHPSVYREPGRTAADCTHWCIAGVPDAWNQIMYAVLLQQD